MGQGAGMLRMPITHWRMRKPTSPTPWLPGNKVSHRHGDTSAHHPIYIEQINHEERLRKFLCERQGEWLHVQAVLFRCEVILSASEQSMISSLIAISAGRRSRRTSRARC